VEERAAWTSAVRGVDRLVTYQESKLQFGVCTDARVSTDRFARFSSAADSLKLSVFVEAQAERVESSGVVDRPSLCKLVAVSPATFQIALGSSAAVTLPSQNGVKAPRETQARSKRMTCLPSLLL
jgi:hypothetical protein